MMSFFDEKSHMMTCDFFRGVFMKDITPNDLLATSKADYIINQKKTKLHIKLVFFCVDIEEKWKIRHMTECLPFTEAPADTLA